MRVLDASTSRRLRHCESGSIAVEFALVAPVLMLILAGVIDIGSATYVKHSLDTRVTAAAEYALLQPAPGDQDAAGALATRLAGLLQGDASETAEIVVNNTARADWTGSAITTASGPGDAAACYCPTVSNGDVTWGSALGCGAPCASGDTAGKFVRISASVQHNAFFPGYAFIADDTVRTSTILRLQ